MHSIRTPKSEYVFDNKWSLPSVNQPLNTKLKRDKTKVLCAFHPTQCITNFCTNSNCLLPLCPRCVKVHLQQHSLIQSTVQLQTIQDCLEQAYKSVNSVLDQSNQLRAFSQQIQDDYNLKKQLSIHQFQRAKIHCFESLTDLFKIYEDTLSKMLSQEDRIFKEHLMDYHRLLSDALDGWRQWSKKLINKNTIMQGLILYYSNTNLHKTLNECQEKLSKISINKIQISYNQSELINLEPIIRKYLSFGDSSTNLMKIIEQNSGGKEYQTRDERRQMEHSGFYWRDFTKYQSKLDTYNLQRSRHTRLLVDSKKNTDLKYIQN